MIHISNKEDYDLDYYEQIERHYDDEYRCKICGSELIRDAEHHEAYGSEFTIPVWFCSDPNCPNS